MKNPFRKKRETGKRPFVPYLFISLVFLSLLLFTDTVQAHKVYIFAWVDQGVVHTESSFGDKKVNQGEIIITDMAGNQLITGKTDAQGNFSFQVPEQPESDLIIKLIAGMGHQAQWKVTLQELKDTNNPETLEKAMDKKAELEKTPPAKNILAGLAVIFGIAFTASIFVKIRRKKKKHE